MGNVPLIQLEEVSVLYPNSRKFVLHGLTLSIEHGEFCSITGKSGTGKSTFMKLLYGGIKPYSGKCRVGEYFLHNLGHREGRALRRKTGIIFQDFHFISKSVFENLSLPLETLRLSKDEIFQRVEKTLDRIGIKDLLDASILELSSGEKQKVAIARSIVHDPILILADDPLRNFDTDVSIEIMDLLHEINHEGKTVIVASNSSGLLKRFQNRELSLP